MTAELPNAFLTALARTLGGVGLAAAGAPERFSAPPRPCGRDAYGATVRFSGSRSGSFSLCCPGPFAAVLASSYVGATISAPEDLRDATAEIANIVAGNATGELAESGVRLEIEPPQILVAGADPWPPEGASACFRVRTPRGAMEVAVSARE